MTINNDHTAVPPTVQHVLEEFVARMRADPDISDDAITGLETLLLKGEIPRPDDIKATLFVPSAVSEA